MEQQTLIEDLIASIPQTEWYPQDSTFQRWPEGEDNPTVVRHEGISYLTQSDEINRIIFDLYHLTPTYHDSQYVYFA